MSRKIVGPFNRVEGDLEVQLDIEDGVVEKAWVVSPMYRGFEQMLNGKQPVDAMSYAPRICGICSVAQSVAAAGALASAQGVSMPANGEYAVNLILANENLADHLTHFYLFFMPDFARQIYKDEPWHAVVAERFTAMQGTAAKDMLPARAQFMHLMGILAGKWPHTLAIQPGGTTRSVKVEEKVRMLNILYQFRRFLEQTLFGDALEHIAGLESAEALQLWMQDEDHRSSDFGLFLNLADALELHTMGRATDHFMSYGVYPCDGDPLFARGVWQGGKLQPLNTDAIREDVSHSWMLNYGEARHPFEGLTQPDPDMKDGYSWCKAPRLDGNVVEVGALARQLVNAHPLMCSLVAQSGGNVRNRVIARLLELALVTMEMERWVKAIRPNEPFCYLASMPDEAEGIGLMEAARGSLGHWLKIKHGRILNYQIIAPTTWNFAPRDLQEQPGALEQALVGARIRPGEKTPVAVQHIVRSFDPCMVCTVH
ncbi:nickel-dependent hydrogenase large subunit [Mariprofundus ferrooxydans]|nr:nickel-dependent hydrogenase large subunit [Mariprofundus ferrooxydans]